jgi:hypothetical protein
MDEILRQSNKSTDCVFFKEPKDISYVYSGYAPISVRFIESFFKSNKRYIQDMCESIPNFGGYFEESQKSTHTIRSKNTKAHCFIDPVIQVIEFVSLFFANLENSNVSVGSGYSMVSAEQKMTLLFFIGGCTYAELSAIRFLGQSEECKYQRFSFFQSEINIINSKQSKSPQKFFNGLFLRFV